MNLRHIGGYKPLTMITFSSDPQREGRFFMPIPARRRALPQTSAGCFRKMHGYVQLLPQTARKRHGLSTSPTVSCSSLLLTNGVPMKQIQAWLGRSTFSTTADIYANLADSAREEIGDWWLICISGSRPAAKTGREARYSRRA